jgi:O-antigen/teichoic acid export membrane protein
MKYALKLGLLLLVVIAPVGIALSATSSLWLPAIFGTGFESATIPLMVFLAFAVLQMAALPVHPLFYALGYARTATAVSALTNGLFLVLAIVMGTQFGLVGFGVAWGLAMMTEAGTKVLVIRRRQSRPEVTTGAPA